MIIPIQQKIPANIGQVEDAIGQPLSNRGRLQYNLQMVKGPCLRVEDGDTLTGTFVSASSHITNQGTAIPTASDGVITFTAGTIYNLVVDEFYFPCIEVGLWSIYGLNGNELVINTGLANPWDTTQDEYFFEAIAGYYLDDSTGNRYPYAAPNTQRIEGQWWNNSNNKYLMIKSKETLDQDALEGPFWFDTNGDPVSYTQNEIETYAQGKSATFFCADQGKGLALYFEILTGEELQDVQDYFGDCNA